ncbi:MAG: polymer-forming cytoskeletal protein [Nitrospiraceae bacterium]|nr:MAG: polymer-forming cytoskeletal protein [Nitrospiraceae bacterium]
MFHKNHEKLESFLGTNTVFKGEIETRGTLRVEGTIEGNINADWVIVGEKSHINGDITARGIVVGGRVDGNLKGKDIVEIKNKGQIHGQIFTSKLSIVEGAIFDGKSSMHAEEAKIIELQTKEKAR